MPSSGSSPPKAASVNNETANNSPAMDQQQPATTTIQPTTTKGSSSSGEASAACAAAAPSSTTGSQDNYNKYCKGDDDSNKDNQPMSKGSPSTSVASSDQALFAARLFGDGIMVRKIKRNGSTHVRIVRCIHVLPVGSDTNTAGAATPRMADSAASSSRGTPSPASSTTTTSSTSHSIVMSRFKGATTSSSSSSSWRPVPANTTSSIMALAWGKTPSQQQRLRRRPSKVTNDDDDDKDAAFLNFDCRTVVPLSAICFIRLGKTTDRAHKNTTAAADCILSLQTNQSRDAVSGNNNSMAVSWPPSLDVEAPTVADRDNLAQNLAEFLQIPIIANDSDPAQSAEEVGNEGLVGPRRRSFGSYDVHSSSGKPPARPRQGSSHQSSGGSAMERPSKSRTQNRLDGSQSGSAYPPPLPPSSSTTNQPQSASALAVSSYASASSCPNASQGVVISMVDGGGQDANRSSDSASEVSTITGNGFDQELVEELHQALNEMRLELEESRAEAARAVKVAEQAIQSAERSNSVEWQNTVTHKAAEAAAMAQKRSAEAMAKQRIAEERLEQEKRNAAFWKKQAEIAGEEAGTLQTRAAAAEVQRATMEERLVSENRKSAALQDLLRKRLDHSEGTQRDALQASLERNRMLEIELRNVRRQLEAKTDSMENREHKLSGRKRLSFNRKPKGPSESSMSLLSSKTNSSSQYVLSSESTHGKSKQIVKIAEEAALIREQFELLRLMTSDELGQITCDTQQWSEQMKAALFFARDESNRLRQSLALESTSRRLLQHEVADLRGRVRVYCRPVSLAASDKPSLLTIQSHETVTLHRERIPGAQEGDLGPLSFEFDRVFPLDATHGDLYQEIEEIALGVLEGYKVCIMAYGQSDAASQSLLGNIVHSDDGVNIENKGIQLLAIEQLFSITAHRQDRYKDSFALSIVEVHNERIADLLADTRKGEEYGEILLADGGGRKKNLTTDDESSVKTTKLEIRTDAHGEVVIQGSLAVKVNSFDDACELWKECLANRRTRLVDLGLDPNEYESASHIIATLVVRSVNITTGLGSIGKIQFVDLAGPTLVTGQPSSMDHKVDPSLEELTRSVTCQIGSNWKFKSRWASIFGEVVVARSQYSRSVPYRNSTLTHLLSDSLDHDTKVVMLACVSSDIKDAQETATTMRLASCARRVWLGKATKHTFESVPFSNS